MPTMKIVQNSTTELRVEHRGLAVRILLIVMLAVFTIVAIVAAVHQAWAELGVTVLGLVLLGSCLHFLGGKSRVHFDGTTNQVTWEHHRFFGGIDSGSISLDEIEAVRIDIETSEKATRRVVLVTTDETIVPLTDCYLGPAPIERVARDVRSWLTLRCSRDVR